MNASHPNPSEQVRDVHCTCDTTLVPAFVIPTGSMEDTLLTICWSTRVGWLRFLLERTFMLIHGEPVV